MKIIDKNADDQVSFLEFQNMVEGHVLDHSIAGVYFVIVTLSEAEAIRAALHHEKRLHGLTKKDDDGKYSKRRSGTRMEHCSYRHSDFYDLIPLLMSSIESHLSNKPKQVFF